MTVKERILRDIIIDRAFVMRQLAIENINDELASKIRGRRPQEHIQDLLNLREQVLISDLEEFLELDSDELSYYMIE